MFLHLPSFVFLVCMSQYCVNGKNHCIYFKDSSNVPITRAAMDLLALRMTRKS